MAECLLHGYTVGETSTEKGVIGNGEGVRGERGGVEEEGQTPWNPVMELPLYPAVYLNEIKSQAQH